MTWKLTDRQMIGIVLVVYGLSIGLNAILTTIALKQYMNPAKGLSMILVFSYANVILNFLFCITLLLLGKRFFKENKRR